MWRARERRQPTLGRGRRGIAGRTAGSDTRSRAPDPAVPTEPEKSRTSQLAASAPSELAGLSPHTSTASNRGGAVVTRSSSTSRA